MLRIIALAATVAIAAGTMAGTASAHPPDLHATYGGGYGTYYTPPTYGNTYGTSAYVAPPYSGVTAPVQRYHPAPAPRPSYSGYVKPSYGYRHQRRAYYAAPAYRPYDGHRSYGPYSRTPTSEGLNYGYAGGPTYGSDRNPVINGVRVQRNPN